MMTRTKLKEVKNHILSLANGPQDLPQYEYSNKATFLGYLFSEVHQARLQLVLSQNKNPFVKVLNEDFGRAPLLSLEKGSI